MRKEKCSFFQSSVKYLGHVLDKEDATVSSDKVGAILQMPCPTDKTQLRSFLGMVNYFNQFFPMMSHHTAPLNHLRKDTPWIWSSDVQTAFEQIKQKLTTLPVLVKVDGTLPLGLACDASDRGVGACLFQFCVDGTERVIEYASRSLAKSEKNYSQIEKEGFSIIFGVQKFRHYLLGLPYGPTIGLRSQSLIVQR